MRETAHIVLARGGLWTLTAADNHAAPSGERRPPGGGYPQPWTAALVAPAQPRARLSTAPDRPCFHQEFFQDQDRRGAIVDI
jgi:hypothetical protein